MEFSRSLQRKSSQEFLWRTYLLYVFAFLLNEHMNLRELQQFSNPYSREFDPLTLYQFLLDVQEKALYPSKQTEHLEFHLLRLSCLLVDDQLF